MSLRQRACACLPAFAGDALDLLSLAGALRADNPKRRNAVIAAGSVAAVTALDVITARQIPA